MAAILLQLEFKVWGQPWTFISAAKMEVVSAATGFKPEQVAKRLANIWSVDGLSLQLVAVVHDPQRQDNHQAHHPNTMA